MILSVKILRCYYSEYIISPSLTDIENEASDKSDFRQVTKEREKICFSKINLDNKIHFRTGCISFNNT